MTGRFSRATVIAAIDMLDAYNGQAATSALMIDLGAEVDAFVPGENTSVAKRMNSLKRFCDQNPDYDTSDGPIADVLVEKATSHLISTDLAERENLLPEVRQFLRRLDQDGFIVAEGAIRRALPDEAEVNLAEAQSELVALLDKHRLTVARGHFDQALNAHGRGEWAGANAQIRAFFDALFDALAERLVPEAAALATGQPHRAKLAAKGFLSRELNEWDDTGKGFFNGLVKRLHPAGSHPGLSDEEDSTFRLHLVLLTTRHFLRRFDQRGGA